MLPKSRRQSIVVSITLWTGSTDQSKADAGDDWLASHVYSRQWNCAPTREIKRHATTWRDTSRRKAISNRRLRSFNKHQRSVMPCDFVGYDWEIYLAWNVSSSIRIINWTSTWRPLLCKALRMICWKLHDTFKHYRCRKIVLSFCITRYSLCDQTGHSDLWIRSVRLAWLRKPLIWLSNMSDTLP